MFMELELKKNYFIDLINNFNKLVRFLRKEQGLFSCTSPDQSREDTTPCVSPFAELISGGRKVLGLNVFEQGRGSQITATKIKYE